MLRPCPVAEGGFLRPAGDGLGRGGIARGRWIGTEGHIEPLARRGSAPETSGIVADRSSIARGTV